MTRRIALALGLTVLLLAPTVVSAGQGWRSDWRRQSAEIRRDLREAARDRQRARAEARRERQFDGPTAGEPIETGGRSATSTAASYAMRCESRGARSATPSAGGGRGAIKKLGIRNANWELGIRVRTQEFKMPTPARSGLDLPQHLQRRPASRQEARPYLSSHSHSRHLVVTNVARRISSQRLRSGDIALSVMER